MLILQTSLQTRRFQPTRPLRGATSIASITSSGNSISTHAPLAGRDLEYLAIRATLKHFNPRAPCGARPTACSSFALDFTFQPTRPLRGATLEELQKKTAKVISTHAPLAGRDQTKKKIKKRHYISTHAPLAGRDCSVRDRCHKYLIFQPTRPLRGATIPPPLSLHRILRFQPTRPLRGATSIASITSSGSSISTHAPLAGRDAVHRAASLRENISTHAPLAGRDLSRSLEEMHMAISTHAPLAGRDRGRSGCRRRPDDFNPRAPCGARPYRPCRPPGTAHFNPRASLRSLVRAHFNPRAPCGARLSSTEAEITPK